MSSQFQQNTLICSGQRQQDTPLNMDAKVYERY